MAKLKPTYAKKEDIPEGVEGFYLEEDGVWKLDADGVEDVTGLKSALSKEREAVKEARKKLVALTEAIGETDPEKVAEILAKAKKAQEDKDKTQVYLEKHRKELEEKDKAIKGLTNQLSLQLVDSEATKAISAAKGSVDLLLPIIRMRTRATLADDGKVVVEVLDANGTPRIGDAKGNAMTIGQLVAEMKESEAYARAFDGKGSSGTGGPSGSEGPPAKTIKADDNKAIEANIEKIASGEIQITD